MNVPNNERRDWSLVIFIIPLGILLIVLVGQLAIRIFPNWSVNANMRSNLDPNAPGQPISFLQPLLPQIMTPMAWAQNYLDQGSDFTFPPFFVFEPTTTASPSPTSVSPTPTTPSPTATTPSPTSNVTATSTPNGGTGTPNPTSTTSTPTPTATTPAPVCEDPDATNEGDPLPCEYPDLCEDPAATNEGEPLPCEYPPTPTGSPTTINPSLTQVTPPTQINVGGTPDNPYGATPPPGPGIGTIGDGTYIVIPLSVEVGLTPDANYDLVYYEFNNNGQVYLDWIIIGLSNFADGSSYYEVFNWGNNIPDTNSNVDTNILSTPPYEACDPPEAPECDDREVVLEDLYDPDGTVSPDPDPNPENNTGVLIDVDNVTSEPPPGTYNYIVIISPSGGSSTTAADIDAVDTVEVPIPTP